MQTVEEAKESVWSKVSVIVVTLKPKNMVRLSVAMASEFDRRHFNSCAQIELAEGARETNQWLVAKMVETGLYRSEDGETIEYVGGDILPYIQERLDRIDSLLGKNQAAHVSDLETDLIEERKILKKLTA